MNADDCLQAVRTAFPSLNARRAQRLGRGWDHWTFLVDEAHAFRFPKNRDAAVAIERIAELLDIIDDRLGIPVPRYLMHGQWEGETFVGYEAIPGNPWHDVGFDDEQTPAVARALGHAVAKLHTVPVADVTSLLDEMPGDWPTACRVAADAAREVITPLLPTRAATVLDTKLDELLRLVDAGIGDEVLLHGDLGLLNIMVDPISKTLTGIIDFDDATIGDSAWDFRLLAEQLPATGYDALLEGYGARQSDSAFRVRVDGYRSLAPIYDALDRLESGDESTAIAILAEWSEAQ